ncbi:MAG: hypothetical protein P4L46_17210 [Fimbriimonas sp.]|nr:hypothetical protein [Fimbriimonas sp.]
MKPRLLPKLAVWKFASCDGCQLSLLNCEDELLAVTSAVEIAYFPEASSNRGAGPFDISLVEGSITTPDERDRIQAVRRRSKVLVAIGACACSGGIQALRNFGSDVELARSVYPNPELLSILETSTPISDHVTVDLELRGCPVSKVQLIEALQALLDGRKPTFENCSVCEECKRGGTTCLLVSKRMPCLGPVTVAGCGALCPAFGRGCYGCFGPKESPNMDAMTSSLRNVGLSDADIVRMFRGINANTPAMANAAKDVR